MNRWLTEVGYLARRSVLRTLRQPAMIVPSILFPLILLAVNSGGLSATTSLPGFPTDSYITFAIAFAFMQGALFAASGAGQDLARDIETGFINRLALTPMRGTALLIGQIAGVVALAVIQAAVFLTVGVLAGVEIAAGVGGAVVVIILAMLISIAYGALGALMALRTGSGEAVQGLFPILFGTLFFTSVSLPRPLIDVDWFRAVATYNPITYLLEGIRSLFVTGWDGRALILGFSVALVLATLALLAGSAALKGRLART